MVLLKCMDLYKSYVTNNNYVNALVDCNIEINAGECVAIVGPKGSGKTSLLRLLGGFERPSDGTIYMNQMNIAAFSDDELSIMRRNEMGYLFQNDSLIPGLTVHENIIMPIVLARRKLDKDYYEDLTDRLHLSGILSRYPKQLSISQLQCVEYARALINQPNIILVDEPINPFYQEMGKEILDFLLNMVHRYHKTLIMVTQDPEISIFADHIIKLNRGVVVEDIVLIKV